MDLHCGTAFPLAMDLPMSYARAYFDHPVFAQHSKARDAQQRLDVAVVERLDGVRKAIFAMGKAMAGR